MSHEPPLLRSSNTIVAARACTDAEKPQGTKSKVAGGWKLMLYNRRSGDGQIIPDALTRYNDMMLRLRVATTPY